MENSTDAAIKGSKANSVYKRSFFIHEDDWGAAFLKKCRTGSYESAPEAAEDEGIEEAEGEEEEAEEREVEEEEEDEDEEMAPENEDVMGTRDWAAEGVSGKGSISVTLTDPDVLDCPICFISLTIPVFQCENGHIACASCCTEVISNKCPSCFFPIGYTRCRALEKVLESVKIPCPNARYGCYDSPIYSKLREHELTCIYTPCSCPLRACKFLGFSKEVYTHFSSRHISAKRIDFHTPKLISLKKNQRFLYLQERTEGIIFVVNHHLNHLGSAVNVICIAPGSSYTRFPYKLIARSEETCKTAEGGETSITLRSVAENIPKWSSTTPLKMFLLVPSDITDPCGLLKLEVCIKNSITW